MARREKYHMVSILGNPPRSTARQSGDPQRRAAFIDDIDYECMQGVLPWSDDVDIAIYRQDLNRLRELGGDMGSPYQFFMNQDIVRREPPIGQVCMAKEGTESEASSSSWRQTSGMDSKGPVMLAPLVDMFAFDVDSKGDVHVRTSKPCRRKFAAAEVLPVRRALVAGMLMPVPCMPHTMLAQVFGPEYLKQPGQNEWSQSWHDSEGDGLLTYCRSAGL